MYEPIHGSAPDIAGKDKVNPIASVLSTAMLLRQIGLEKEAQAVEGAVASAIADGLRTQDLILEQDAGKFTPIGTDAMGTAIAERVAKAFA